MSRPKSVQYLNPGNSSSGVCRRSPIEHIIAAALVAEGYTTLDQQAKALGIHRNTTWTIVREKHKLGRLNSGTTRRILANPDTPASVRDVIRQYLAERLAPTDD
jgi:hypothetical protein